MTVFKRLYDWLNLRPEETRLLWPCFAGAFLIVGFMIMARSLREALFLDAFPVQSLPYMTATVVALGLPVSALFSRFLSRFQAQGVLKMTVLLALAGIAALWPVADIHFSTIVAFYIWTFLSSLLLTAGFWIVVAEHFPVRGAKRLYGLISAGGTAGALVAGTSLQPLTKMLPIWELLPILMGFLGLFWAVLVALPKAEKAKVSSKSERVSWREQIRLVKESPYLQAIAIIVVTATLASSLLDYQFKEFVKTRLETKATMAGFFGGFYGWTGGVALLLQIILTSRLMSRFGVGVTLCVLPLILIAGGATILFLSSFTLLIATRGADNSLRKSLHRSAIEVLYLPVPSLLRRKTKTFVDSVLDSAAEGIGALVIFLWVTLGHFPSRYLSVLILVSSFIFLHQVRRVSRQYYRTLEERLKEGEKCEVSKEPGEADYEQDLLDVSLSAIDLKETLKRKKGIVFEKQPPRSQAAAPKISPQAAGPPTLKKAEEKLSDGKTLEAAEISALLRSLQDDAGYIRLCRVVADHSAEALEPLAATLLDEKMDPAFRRRIPRILPQIPSEKGDRALLDGLLVEDFEIRYRAAVALMKRVKTGLIRLPKEDMDERLWETVRFEVGQQRPVWEMQKILDQLDENERDDFPQESLEALGSLSLEHVFRLLALILDAKMIKATYRCLKSSDEKLRSFALEYLDHVLPDDVKGKLWLFIGDVSERVIETEIRSVDVVAKELLESEATLSVDRKTEARLIEAVKKVEKKEEEKEKKKEAAQEPKGASR